LRSIGTRGHEHDSNRAFADWIGPGPGRPGRSPPFSCFRITPPAACDPCNRAAPAPFPFPFCLLVFLPPPAALLPCVRESTSSSRFQFRRPRPRASPPLARRRRGLDRLASPVATGLVTSCATPCHRGLTGTAYPHSGGRRQDKRSRATSIPAALRCRSALELHIHQQQQQHASTSGSGRER